MQDLIIMSISGICPGLDPIDGDVAAEGEDVRYSGLQLALLRVGDPADPVLEEGVGDLGADEDILRVGPGVES